MSESDFVTSDKQLPCYQIILGESSRIYPVSAEFVVGRGRLCDMRLVAFDVSRLHCEIRCTDEGWNVTNKSLYGLSLNGHVYKGPKVLNLNNSDILILGSVYLQIFVEIDEKRYRVPVRTLRFNVLVGVEMCSLNVGNGLWENNLAKLGEKATNDKKDENIESENESSSIVAECKENLERATVIQTAGKVDLDLMDELIKVRQQNVLLARELEETNAAYKRAVEEKNEAVAKLEELGNGVSDVFEELIETELQCSICHEVVVNATTSNCSHTFCEYCFLKWTKKNKACPVCRTSISKNIRTKMIDSFVEKLVARFPADYQDRRKEILESRKELTQALTENPRPRKRRKRSITAASHNGRQAITITLQNLGSLMDTTIDISSDDDSPVFLFQQRL